MKFPVLHVQVEWTELNRKNMDPVLAARTVVEQQMVSCKSNAPTKI